LSTAFGHNVTKRDNVTVTPEKSREITPPPVDNSGDNASGAAAGPSDDGTSGKGEDPRIAAELWLGSEGKRIVAERMEEEPARAMTRISRWRDQQLDGDPIALVEVIRAADKADYLGPRFHNLVVDGIRRAPRPWPAQAELKLPPALISERKLG